MRFRIPLTELIILIGTCCVSFMIFGLTSVHEMYVEQAAAERAAEKSIDDEPRIVREFTELHGEDAFDERHRPENLPERSQWKFRRSSLDCRAE